MSLPGLVFILGLCDNWRMANPNLDEVETPPELTHVKFKGLERIRPVFFYQRVAEDFDEGQGPDEDLLFEGAAGGKSDEIFACYEQEAAALHEGTNKGKFRQIGVGDGKAWFNVIKTSGIKRGERITIERQKEIMKQAFDAELEAARGHKRRPIGIHRHVAGVSADVQNPEELIQSFTGGRR
jgi:hypothetical protein